MVMQTSGLKVGYGKQAILTGINIETCKGQVIGILGPNGSGKTTLLRTLAGLLAPLDGTVSLDHRNLDTFSQAELARRLAVVLTDHNAPQYLSVFTLVASGRYPYVDFHGTLKAEDLKKVTEALELVGAGHLAERYFTELSDGEQQKVLLARALAQETELIILDEPASYLDLKNRQELLEILLRLSRERGITVLLSLHEIDVALKCCEIVVLVKDGEVRGWGPPEMILNETLIRELYGLDRLSFNIKLGASELRNRRPPEIMVIGGDGTGTPVYRLLSKNGYGFCTGILHHNDLDFQVAITMGVPVIAVPAFQMIDPESLRLAKRSIATVKMVIDTGFPVGVLNRTNLELLSETAAFRKAVLTLRNPEEPEFSLVNGKRALLSELISLIKTEIG